MAGDTPGADRVSRQRRLAHLDVAGLNSSDKYYASRTPSPLSASRADTRPGGDRPAPPKTRRLHHLEQLSGDHKYYANGGLSPAQALAQARAQPRSRVQLPGVAAAPEVRVGLVRVSRLDQVGEAVAAVVGQLQRGPVTVEVADQPADLMRRLRAALDAQVAAEAIDEDQRRDVRFAKTPAALFAVTPPPTPVPGLAAVAAAPSVLDDGGVDPELSLEPDADPYDVDPAPESSDDRLTTPEFVDAVFETANAEAANAEAAAPTGFAAGFAADFSAPVEPVEQAELLEQAAEVRDAAEAAEEAEAPEGGEVEAPEAGEVEAPETHRRSGRRRR